MCEYVDHLHEHFKYPVLIREAAYMPPKVSLQCPNPQASSEGLPAPPYCSGELDPHPHPRAQSLVSSESVFII